MAILQRLIGKPLEECTLEELENWVSQGRMAREANAEGGKKGKGKGSGKVSAAKKMEAAFADLELELDDDELED